MSISQGNHINTNYFKKLQKCISDLHRVFKVILTIHKNMHIAFREGKLPVLPMINAYARIYTKR